jgi:hypothetical protein
MHAHIPFGFPTAQGAFALFLAAFGMFAHQPARQDAHARLRGMLPHCRPEQEDKRAESKRMIHFFEAGLAKMPVGNPFETCSVPSCDLRAPLLRSKAGFKHFSANKQCLPRHVFFGGDTS